MTIRAGRSGITQCPCTARMTLFVQTVFKLTSISNLYAGVIRHASSQNTILVLQLSHSWQITLSSQKLVYDDHRHIILQ